MIWKDLERNGGTWGANSETTANAVLDFFGETQTIGKISIYKNVGITISILEELAKYINIYVSTTDEPLKLRRKEDKIDDIAWKKNLPFRHHHGRGMAEHNPFRTCQGKIHPR